jgi:DNA-directed RNA polymerase alpha subunit
MIRRNEMVKLWFQHEIPKGYQETLKMNNIDINDVKYIVEADSGAGEIAKQLGSVKAISTITEHWLHVVYEKQNDITIEELDFSVMVYNSLKRNGINYKSEIEQMTEKDILKIRNMDTRRLLEIKEKVNIQ